MNKLRLTDMSFEGGNMIEKMIRYENGEMGVDEIVPFFQELINSGMAWTLQGHYGRTASALIEAGECKGN